MDYDNSNQSSDSSQSKTACGGTISNLVNRDEKSIWYKIYDSQMRESLYVPAHEMRVIPPGELALLSPEVPEEEKRIYIDLASQTVTAFEAENPVFVARCASGAKGTETPLGVFGT